jgi:hypothetical protein
MRGFDSFKAMRGADEFLDTINRREIALMNEILGAAPDA